MKTLPFAAAVAVLALPGSALAAGSHGVVLSVDRAHHSVELVDAHHFVRDFHYRGRLGHLRVGSRLSFRSRGATITQVQQVQSGSRTVSFYGRVLRSSTRGLTLALADGKRVRFSSHQVRSARQRSAKHRRTHAPLSLLSSGAVNINVVGLQPGVTVLVTETVDASGNVTITITLPPAAVPGVTASQQVDGVLTDVGQDVFMLQTPDGSELRLHMAGDALAAQNLNVCDTVQVSYHQDAQLLIADSVQNTGTSTSGDCTGSSDSGGNGGSTGAPADVVGTITAVSSTGLTVGTDQGPMSFTVDSADITDGFSAGDVVDVSYAQAADGSLDASDVEYAEQDVSGTVSAVTSASLTLVDGSGASHTFTGDPAQGVFDGVSQGDQVDVTYHQSSGQAVADVVNDQSVSGDSSSGGDS